jgi:hypothetical protein
VLAVLEGEVLAVLEGDLVSDEASHLVRRLRIRLVRDGLPRPTPTSKRWPER